MTEIGMLNTRGAVLLEVLVALTILATAGLSLIDVVGAGLRDEVRLEGRERTIGAANRVLTALTLLSRRDLDQRLGQHPLGEFLVEVERPERVLYRIALREAKAPDLDLLVTVVYRPEAERRP